MTICLRAIAITTLLVTSRLNESSAGEVSGLVVDLPATTNTLVVIDYRGLARQPEGRQLIQATDLMQAPAGTESLLLASDLDFAYLAPAWNLAYVAFKANPVIRKKVDAQLVDSIEGHDVKWLDPRHFALVPDPQTLGVVGPISRQSAARWLRREGHSTAPLQVSEFLRFAGEVIDDPRKVMVIALDFRNALSVATARQMIEDSGVVASSQVDDISKLVAGLEGAVLSISSADSITGRLQMRFAGDVQPLESTAPRLLSHILRSVGAALTDVETWGTHGEKNVLTLEGDLSLDGLQRLTSLAVNDSDSLRLLRRLLKNLDSVPNDSATSVTAPSLSAQRSQATIDHFQAVRRLLGALDRRSESSTWFQSRVWLDRFAVKIEFLDRDHVDEEVLKVSDSIAERLRGMASALQEAGTLVAAEMANSGWMSLPTTDFINYGGVPVSRPILHYVGGSAEFLNRVQATGVMRDTLVEIRESALTIVRDVNELGEHLSIKYEMPFDRWEPEPFR